jgi:RNA polymerase sigma-70 factor (ECF subfamily)
MSPDADLHKADNDFSFNDRRFGDVEFEDFFKENFIESCNYCQYKFGFDIHEAKEAVHTAFISLWESRHHFSSPQEVRSFIKKVITNKCLDMIRHEKVRKKYEKYIMNRHSALFPENDYQVGDFRKLQMDIDQAVADLPEQMRRVFEMSRYEQLKYAQIAATLDISVKTVETQISRALVKLREKLADYLILFVLMMLQALL